MTKSKSSSSSLSIRIVWETEPDDVSGARMSRMALDITDTETDA